MYFVVPKGRSVLKSVYKSHDLYMAQKTADRMHEEEGTHFDVIRMESCYTTQKLWELLEQDMALTEEGFKS